MPGSTSGAPCCSTLNGLPERTIPFAPNAFTCSNGIVQGWISQYTCSSRILLAMSCVYCDPKSRMRMRSAWMSAMWAAQCSGKIASLQTDASDVIGLRYPCRFVVESAAPADVGGARFRKQVGVAVFAEMAALGHDGDVAALAGVVAN